MTITPNINAPIINEYPLTLECKVVELMERPEGGCFVIGEIVNTVADPSILTDGKIDLARHGAVAKCSLRNNCLLYIDGFLKSYSDFGKPSLFLFVNGYVAQVEGIHGVAAQAVDVLVGEVQHLVIV